MKTADRFDTVVFQPGALAGGGVELQTALVPKDGSAPFAIITYAHGGIPQALGLRLDRDKQVFLDHLDGAAGVWLETIGPAVVAALRR